MEDQTYNGWKNYPTWAVNLWLSNDEGLYDHATAVVRDAFDNAEEDRGRLDAADHLRYWVREDLAPDLGASFAADLLGYALDLVDWFEIADAFAEIVEEAR